MVGYEPDGPRSWLVTGVATLALVFTFGTPFSFGVLVDPLHARSGVAEVALSTVFSLMFFTFYVFAGLLGVFVNRVRARPVLLVAALTTLAVAPTLYVVDSYLAFLVVFSVLGTTLGVVFVVLASIVPQWFDARRGLATGVLFVGTGASLSVMPPVWTVTIDSVGVARGFLLVVGCSGLTFLLAGTICRRPPWHGGDDPDGVALVPWLRARLGSGRFWALFVGIGLSLAWYYLLAGYAVGFFRARGFGRTTASVAFGLVGGISIASRLASGAVADRVGYVRALLVAVALAAVGSAVLLAPGVPAVAVGILLLGIALGGISTLYIPVLLAVYTPEKDTAIIGLFNVSMGLFAVAAPPVATALVATSGGYRAVVLLTAAAPVVAWLVLRLAVPTAAGGEAATR